MIAAEHMEVWTGAEAADGARSGMGRAVVLERTASARRAMVPLHSRDEDETFSVVEGELTFFVGGEVVRATPGDVVVAPRHVPRTLRVESEEARWLVTTRVRSLGRFEDFGRALVRPSATAAAAWASAEDEATLRALGAANGIALLGPPGLLPSDL
ncbi:MAG: cupin domain-containing protein [Candidatus Limnocylindria bacterium]